ncbi:MAG: glycosyltransferase family 39 protein [Candidatus Omnitrophota bacterium]
MLSKVSSGKRKWLGFFLLAFVCVATVNFIKFNSMNLASSGHWLYDLTEFEDKARFQDWEDVVAGEDSQFFTEFCSDKNHLISDMLFYSYATLPAYLTYKIMPFRGPAFWILQRVLHSILGILAVLLIFLIADLCYGPLVGFLASLFAAFCPHIWIAYNFDTAIQRGFNLFFSLLFVYFFLRSLKQVRWRWLILAAFAMGVNFLFFHMGSHMMPIIVFLFCVYKAIADRRSFSQAHLKRTHIVKDKESFNVSWPLLLKIRPGHQSPRFIKSAWMSYLVYFLLIVLIAVTFAFLLNLFHTLYFHLPSSPQTWFESYFKKGSVASHTVENFVLLDKHRLLTNLSEHIHGMFIDGKTSDWHYSMSPPGVPYIHNYAISFFFVISVFLAFWRRRDKDVFFVIWFLAFFLIYSFLIVVRQKNILWETPAIFILAASAVPEVAAFIYRRVKLFSKRAWTIFLAAIMALSSVVTGSYYIFSFLPAKNFYNAGGQMGTYQLYQYLKNQGYTWQSKIVFTLPDVNLGHMMLRLFTQKTPDIVCMSHYGVGTPLKDDDWKKAESQLKKDSDKLFFCFLYFENGLGVNYITDNYWREIFNRLHPESEPFEIKGFDGKTIWRVYEIKGDL